MKNLILASTVLALLVLAALLWLAALGLFFMSFLPNGEIEVSLQIDGFGLIGAGAVVIVYLGARLDGK